MINSEPPGPESSHPARAWFVGAVFLMAVGAIGLGLLPEPGGHYRPLQTIGGESESGSWVRGGYAAPELSGRFDRVEGRGSWINSPEGANGFVGEYRSAWYVPAPSAFIMVCGYPSLPGNRLELEVLEGQGRETAVRFTSVDPGERWAAWRVGLPPGCVRFRVHGVDGNQGFRGWLGVSRPFVRTLFGTIRILPLARTFCSVAISLLVVLGPGLLWRAWRKGSLAAVIWVGPLFLAAGGAVCWAAGGLIRPSTLAMAWLAATIVALAAGGWKLRPWLGWTRLETAILALMGLTVLGVAGKAAISAGPEGELYGGSISRSLEVGSRSDSRISYHNLQLVANHEGPDSERARDYFGPFNYSHRGPLAGLVAAPIVLATGARPPAGKPDQGWEPFDASGFATYRIAMATLAVLAVAAVFDLLVRVGGEASGALGVGLLVLSPFYWHEAWFSWPKMAAAACVIAAFTSGLSGSGWRAGLGLGAGYLFHPLALLSGPFMGLWLIIAGRGSPRRRLAHAAAFGAALAAVIAGWFLFNIGHFRQDGFLRYFTMAEGGTATWSTWWRSRLDELADTFVPLYTWLLHGDHGEFNAFAGRSDRWTQFLMQPWMSFPFAIGIVAWCALAPSFIRGVARRPGAFALLLGGPALFLLLYWGAPGTGLMRECGHVIFLSAWVFLAWAAGDRAWTWAASAGFVGLRAMELILMIFATSVGMLFREQGGLYLLNDWFCLGLSVACVGLAARLVWRLGGMPR